MKKGIVNYTCFLFGHSGKEGLNDSGYGICDRCGMHSYYDDEMDIRQWPRFSDYPFYSSIIWWIKIKIRNPIRGLYYKTKERFLFRTCDYCQSKARKIFWTNHECPNCKKFNLPF